jgi:hypothetical protein
MEPYTCHCGSASSGMLLLPGYLSVPPRALCHTAAAHCGTACAYDMHKQLTVLLPHTSTVAHCKLPINPQRLLSYSGQVPNYVVLIIHHSKLCSACDVSCCAVLCLCLTGW